MKTGVQFIAEERSRHKGEELDWTDEHDDQYEDDELAFAGAVYTLPAVAREFDYVKKKLKYWPWDIQWYKPTPRNRVKELSKAGALIAAEIDRLLREKERDRISELADCNCEEYEISEVNNVKYCSNCGTNRVDLNPFLYRGHEYYT